MNSGVACGAIGDVQGTFFLAVETVWSQLVSRIIFSMMMTGTVSGLMCEGLTPFWMWMRLTPRNNRFYPITVVRWRRREQAT